MLIAGRVFKLNKAKFHTVKREMGRAVATRGERRLGRVIRKLENSVELSSEEGKAKIAEAKYKQAKQKSQGYAEDSAIQDLRDPAKWKKKEK